MKDPKSESYGQLPQEGRNVSSLFGIVAAASQTLRTLLGDLWNDPKTTCNSEADAFNQLMHIYLGTYDPYMSKWQAAYEQGGNMATFLAANPELVLHLATAAAAKFPAAAPGSCERAASWASTETSSFLLWNCRSIRNKNRELEKLLRTPAKRPAIVALTETHLRTIDLNSTWLRQMLPGYIVFASCHPSSTAVRWTRRDPQTPRPSKSYARAGTLLAVHADWAQGHLVRQHQPPAALQGYVSHISITMPDSMPLHIMAVYQPNGETWRITAYIKTTIALAHAAGGSVVLAGDWNAVQQASDRQPSAHLNPME